MRRTSLLTALLLLVPAASAMAKEVAATTLCGPSECREVRDREALAAFHEGGPPADPPRAAPWYRATVTVHAGDASDRFAIVTVPSAGMIRSERQPQGGYTWMRLAPRAAAVHRGLAQGLEPFPAATLRGLESPPPPKVRVDEVVLPPEDPADGGLRWLPLAGGLGLVVTGGVLALRRRVRRAAREPGHGPAGP